MNPPENPFLVGERVGWRESTSGVAAKKRPAETWAIRSDSSVGRCSGVVSGEDSAIGLELVAFDLHVGTTLGLGRQGCVLLGVAGVSCRRVSILSPWTRLSTMSDIVETLPHRVAYVASGRASCPPPMHPASPRD